MRRNLAIVIVLMMGLAACAGGDSATEPESTIAPTADDGRAAGAEDVDQAATEEAAEGEPVALSTPEARKVIHRASISIEAEDTRSVYEEVQRMVDEADGFIESATVSDPDTGEDQPRIEVVLRIPADDLTSTLDGIGALGTRIVSQTQSGEDVTEEYVDVEARIGNLSLLETELKELLADVRQQDEVDPAKLLQVFNEISRVRGEVEQLEGRRQVLDDLTSLATVTAKIAPTPESKPVVAEGWAPLAVARQALQDLVGAFQGVGDVVIRLGLYVLPLAVLFLGLPALVVWRFRHKLAFSRDIPDL